MFAKTARYIADVSDEVNMTMQIKQNMLLLYRIQQHAFNSAVLK